MNPILAPLHELPKDMLFVIPTVDFLLYEQMEMVERLQNEIEATQQKTDRTVEKAMFEGQFHGWLERRYSLPSGSDCNISEERNSTANVGNKQYLPR